MEILGQGLMALGSAIGSIAAAFGFIGVAAIAAGTFLIYMDKATFEEMAKFVQMLKGNGRHGGWPH